ncbi:MAG: hypothetical protein KDC49_11465 [Saprospiraceae bacterium]|nr:hypothetical protein [Saprospiraceae bacterium]
MKYRRLTLEELEIFEKEFILFLSANGITGEDWEKKKQAQDPMVNLMLDEFSDFILDGVLQNVEYIDHRSPAFLACFNIKENFGEAIIVQRSSTAFEDISDIKVLMDLIQNRPQELQINLATKVLGSQEERNKFIFDELSKGAMISNAELFDLLKPLTQ